MFEMTTGESLFNTTIFNAFPCLILIGFFQFYAGRSWDVQWAGIYCILSSVVRIILCYLLTCYVICGVILQPSKYDSKLGVRLCAMSKKHEEHDMETEIWD
jgi:hypothetical protein